MGASRPHLRAGRMPALQKPNLPRLSQSSQPTALRLRLPGRRSAGGLPRGSSAGGRRTRMPRRCRRPRRQTTVNGAPRCSRNTSREQRTERRHAHKHHGVHRHHAATQMVRSHRLNQRVRRRHSQHHAESHRQQQSDRQPEITREGKQHQAETEAAAGECDPAAQSQNAGARRQA